MTGMILVDLQKAFDMIDHDILLKKLSAIDSCLIFQRKDVIEIEKQLNKGFKNICEWFVDKKLSIHFGQDKTKSILFASKRKIKRVTKLNYRNIQIKQHSKVTYLGCILDETMSGESVALNVINKINSRLKFRHKKTNF